MFFRYTSLMASFDETLTRTSKDESDGTPCDRCGRLCEPLEVDVCPICKKNFCIYCVYRVGSRNYCSRSCGDAFFFGTDDDEPAEE
jgi:hypothetical protein